MKPGDIVTIRKMNISHRYPIDYVDVYDRIDERCMSYNKKWEHGEIGILLEGHDEDQEMIQVFHHGRIGWVDEELLIKTPD